MIVNTEHTTFGVGHRETSSHTTFEMSGYPLKAGESSGKANYIRDNSFVPPFASVFSGDLELQADWRFPKITYKKGSFTFLAIQ